MKHSSCIGPCLIFPQRDSGATLCIFFCLRRDVVAHLSLFLLFRFQSLSSGAFPARIFPSPPSPGWRCLTLSFLSTREPLRQVERFLDLGCGSGLSSFSLVVVFLLHIAFFFFRVVLALVTPLLFGAGRKGDRSIASFPYLAWRDRRDCLSTVAFSPCATFFKRLGVFFFAPFLFLFLLQPPRQAFS